VARVSVRAFERLERRALRRRSHLRATHAYFDRRTQRVVIVLRNGMELAVLRKLLLPLTGCRVSDISDLLLSPAGYYLRWPRLDAYLWIGDLLALTFRTELGESSRSRAVIGTHARRRRTASIECVPWP